ncbi:hypothetical protein DEO72_LG5g702 [Vigna unguiculata]|uniref:Uncharacterized protein n=1 Tax=Vigna unguiculata TaxID=3917 RepID=A0A4D6LXM5_VIGUN|nr:hypothetical protein DEO72_LG5g702 [Vigna unguiculata]
MESRRSEFVNGSTSIKHKVLVLAKSEKYYNDEKYFKMLCTRFEFHYFDML